MKNTKVQILILFIIICVTIIYLFWYYKYSSDYPVEIKADTLINTEIKMNEYGFPADSFYFIYGTVAKNENLAEILLKYNVEYSLIEQISKKWKHVFDVRKLRTGNKYSIFCSSDTVQKLIYFIYETGPIEYILFDFSDSLNITRQSRNVISFRKTVYGSIESSLWNAIIKNRINPMLALFLEDIYCWEIDFFELQKNDCFKVIYEEQFIDTISAGIKKIYGAWFRHNGNEYYAIPFVQDSIESYFDTSGFSLRKAFLKAPLRYSRISSRFSHSRLHPVLKIRRPHHGVDYAAPAGTPVMSIGDGKVIQAGWSGGAGRLVKIKHNSLYTSVYMHLSKFGKNIKPGVNVRQGDIIGYVGSSGLSTGPHLDFRMFKDGKAVDPTTIKSPPSEPVKKDKQAEFETINKRIIEELGL
ncbi:MAG: peptidoglycan DD-metalloendopeptidase family protein [Bacteroidia bacterium]|nr:peptidoglycan DD-metalloendopeptidase family protein [Bacteroidia bacterium]